MQTYFPLFSWRKTSDRLFMSQSHVQPWGVLLISMANNMTYESKGDIHLPPFLPPSPSVSLPLPLPFSLSLSLCASPSTSSVGWATEASTKDTFACDDLATRCVLVHRISSFSLRAELHWERVVQLCVTIWSSSRSAIWSCTTVNQSKSAYSKPSRRESNWSL